MIRPGAVVDVLGGHARRHLGTRKNGHVHSRHEANATVSTARVRTIAAQRVAERERISEFDGIRSRKRIVTNCTGRIEAQIRFVHATFWIFDHIERPFRRYWTDECNCAEHQDDNTCRYFAHFVLRSHEETPAASRQRTRRVSNSQVGTHRMMVFPSLAIRLDPLSHRLELRDEGATQRHGWRSWKVEELTSRDIAAPRAARTVGHDGLPLRSAACRTGSRPRGAAAAP